MGSSASSINNIRSEFTFGDYMDDVHAKTSNVVPGVALDVCASQDVNFSEQINPRWSDTIRISGKGLRTKIEGEIGCHSHLLDAVSNLTNGSRRVLLGDGEVFNKVITLEKKIMNKMGSLELVTNEYRVTFDLFKELIEYQKEIVNGLKLAHDMYGSLTLGSTGMRNAEVKYIPTPQSLAGCYQRASEDEKRLQNDIIDIMGPRVGFFRKNSYIDSGTIVYDTMNDNLTNYGTMKSIRDQGTLQAKLQREIKFSDLHADGVLMGRTGRLSRGSWTTNHKFGVITEMDYQSNLGDNGLNTIEITQASKAYENLHVHNVEKADGLDDLDDYVTFTSYGWQTNYREVDFRSKTMCVSGTLEFVASKTTAGMQETLGVMYHKDRRLRFAPFLYIDEDDPNLKTVEQMERHPRFKQKVNSDDRTFTVYFKSKFEVVIPYTGMDWNPTLSQYFKDAPSTSWGFMIVMTTQIARPDGDVFSIRVEIDQFETKFNVISDPDSFVYMGSKYTKSVVELLGEVPHFYETDDIHDPVYIYDGVISKLLPFKNRIAKLHVSTEGAALALSLAHMKRAYTNIGQNVTEDVLKQTIIDIIIQVDNLMYKDGPLSIFKLEDRIILFMHFVEKVMIQLLTHINVYSTAESLVQNDYVKDCKLFEKIEADFDKNLMTSEC